MIPLWKNKMVFSEIKRRVYAYLHFQENAELKDMVNQFVNESIIDFIRLQTWSKTIVAEDLLLDNSDSYDLATLTNFFDSEVALVNPDANVEYDKYNYKNYLELVTKTNKYAVLADTIYVTGDDTTLKLFFNSPGTNANYPVSVDSDEPNALKYYWDIIIKQTIVKFNEFIGDREEVESEMKLLGIKLQALRKHENRADHSGKYANVKR